MDRELDYLVQLYGRTEVARRLLSHIEEAEADARRFKREYLDALSDLRRRDARWLRIKNAELAAKRY